MAMVFALFISMQLFLTTNPVTGEITDFHPIAVIPLFLCVWVGWANSLRRLHDLGHNGFYMLILFIPLVGSIFSLYMLFGKGENRPNSFGPVPGMPTQEKLTEQREERHFEQVGAATDPDASYLNEDGSFNMDGLFK